AWSAVLRARASREALRGRCCARLGVQTPYSPSERRRLSEIHEPPSPRRQPVPPAARAQPGELVLVGGRGLRARSRGKEAGPSLRRLLDLPLVPRDGGGVVRGRGD